MTKQVINITREQFDQWLVDLRSGEFKQSKAWLKTNDGYCCLGVLGERLEGFNDSLVYLKTSGTSIGIHELKNSQQASFLPEEYINHGIQGELSLLNDNKDKSFLEIADWIEANLTWTEAA